MNPWPAPAKLNLFLHILGRRADGYHELQTAFQFVDLCDEIHLRVRNDDQILRGAGPDIAAEDDLTVRAALALQSAAGCKLGAQIEIVKKIPMGGGLGGGSSDAATVLVALNRLWHIDWPADRLREVGLKLGADVPVFVGGEAAWAEGVGERLTPLVGREAPFERMYLIVNPNCSVETAKVFQATELTRNSPAITICGFLDAGGRNDCTSTVRARYPAVAHALDWLSAHGDARLTGTGGCCFLACESLESAEQLQRALPSEFTGYVARGLNRSPLLARLAAEREVDA
jgi:4-diphosphocytidyl-2-C-methyl-D-erythritol kinase